LAAAAPLGMPSGKTGHHPGWKPLQGSASDRTPGWAPSPCRLPGPVKGGVFSEPSCFLFTNVPSSPHTSSHMFGHHPATVRLAGRKGHARFVSSEALAELSAVAHTAVELHGCCARVSLAAALLSQHVDCVTTRAGSPGTESRSRARSLILLSTMLAPVVENRTGGGSARARRRSELAQIADTAVRHEQLSSPLARHGVAVGDLPIKLPVSARSS
jgi:hypothetical protein